MRLGVIGHQLVLDGCDLDKPAGSRLREEERIGCQQGVVLRNFMAWEARACHQ